MDDLKKIEHINNDMFVRRMFQKALESKKQTFVFHGIKFVAAKFIYKEYDNYFSDESFIKLMNLQLKQEEYFYENLKEKQMDSVYISIQNTNSTIHRTFELYMYIPKKLERMFLHIKKEFDEYNLFYDKDDKYIFKTDILAYRYIDIVTIIRKYIEFRESRKPIKCYRHGYYAYPEKIPLYTNDFFKYQKKYIFKEYRPSEESVKEKYLIGTYRIYGEVRFYQESKIYLRDGKVELIGDATRIEGDVTDLYGKIHPDLYGDVSGLKGNITNVVGDATGININLGFGYRRETLDLSTFRYSSIDKSYELLSNEDNITLMKVWSCLCHHTIGVTDEERELFDAPVKVKPPFPVDRHGRHYMKYDDEHLIVYSVNPADIMLAKDVNKCSTCFCLHSESEKWHLGMKCLIALNSVNKNLGVCYLIKRHAVKKLCQFKDFKFKWYDPDAASFFQYDSKKMYVWDSYLNRITDNSQPDNIDGLYGHDGMKQLGHERQKSLAYLETLEKDCWKWFRGADAEFPLVNNYKDFTRDEISDDWKRQIDIANAKAKELLETLKG